MKLALCIMGLLLILFIVGIWKGSQPVRQIKKAKQDISQSQQELTDFAKKQRDYYKKTHDGY